MTPGSASVLIIFEDEGGLAQGDMPADVAKLVAGAAGIAPSSVAVLVSKVATVSTTKSSTQALQDHDNIAKSAKTGVILDRPTLSGDPSVEIALSLLIIGIAGVLTVVRRSKEKRAV